MSKVTVLPYESPRCIVCGRDLPRDRRQKCYVCRPPKSRIDSPARKPDLFGREPYTIEDCCALAWAYGIDYGEVRRILDYNLPWPPRKRPLRWPAGSAHAGEK